MDRGDTPATTRREAERTEWKPQGMQPAKQEGKDMANDAAQHEEGGIVACRWQGRGAPLRCDVDCW